MTENYLYQLADRAIADILTDAEKADLDAYLNDSAENRTEFAEIKSILEMSNATLSAISPDSEGEWRKLEAKLFDQAVEVPLAPTGKTMPLWGKSVPWLGAAAAVILAVLGVYFWLLDNDLPSNRMLYSAIAGEQKEIHLADGSTVSLNGNSKIQTADDFGTSSRHLSLVGEAYFEVAEDKSKPFVVTAGKVTAEALGTKFNVRKADKDEAVQLSVVEGKVRFSDLNHQQELILVADQVAHFDPISGKLQMDGNNAADEAAWRLQKLVFKDSDFPSAAQRIERQFGVQIHFPERLKSARLTANFEKKELAQVLEVLESIYTLKATKTNDVVTLAD